MTPRTQRHWPIVFALVLLAACGSDPTAPPPLLVTSVEPRTGPLTGGTSVTIMGVNFTEITSVSIDGKSLGAIKVLSATEITGSTPSATSAGPKDLVVTSSIHGSDTCNGCFSYASPSDTERR
jgi:hypothetical protein